MSIEEIRQKLEDSRALYPGADPQAFDRTVDNLVASLRAQYGEDIPVVEVVKVLRTLSFPTAPLAPSQNAGKPPDGINVEWTLAGFVLNASRRSIIGGMMWAAFVGALVAIPFRLWGGLILGAWTNEGASLWLANAFLAIWAGGVLYVAAIGAVSFFGEIRIVKEGDSGEIFTGVGKIGRTRRVLWSDFYGAGDRGAVSVSSRGFDHTTHYVRLNGTSKNYKFGSELTAEQQAFVIAFLREHVFGSPAVQVQRVATRSPPSTV